MQGVVAVHRFRRMLLVAFVPMALTLVTAVGALACAGPGGGLEEPPPRPEETEPPTTPRETMDLPESLDFRVLDEHPHARDAFTQGLLLHEGFLYESTGLNGRSTLRKVNPTTGEVLVRRELPATIFAEGLALVPSPDGDRLIQLTWRDGMALVWDLERMERVGELRYTGEGWGLTFDGRRLIMSDGTSILAFRDPQTFEKIGEIEVTLAGHPLSRLNELEWAEGRIWANVWGSTTVVAIDPATGKVTGTVDLGDLVARLEPTESLRIDVLNGIAFRPGNGRALDSTGGTFLVTGKLWPRLFEVTFEPRIP